MTIVVGEGQAEAPLFDDAGLRQWTEDLSREQVQEILAKVPDDCCAAVDEITAAVEAKNLQTVRRLAHRLKGMASNLGATRLADAARAIELGSDWQGENSDRLSRLRIVVSDTNRAIVELCKSIG